jgi:hypothetical protein
VFSIMDSFTVDSPSPPASGNLLAGRVLRHWIKDAPR